MTRFGDEPAMDAESGMIEATDDISPHPNGAR
jgi:hypothetical protein